MIKMAMRVDRSAFIQFGAKVEGALVGVVSRTAQKAADAARQNCPVRTGYLRDSIEARPISSDFAREANLTTAESSTEFAPYWAASYSDPAMQAIGVGPQGLSGESLAWEVGVDAPYALYVELGTSKMAARPFTTQAVDSVASEFIAEVAEVVNSVV